MPQYKYAVEKAHATEAMAILRTAKNSQETYQLATGSYATTFDVLDIDLLDANNRFFSYDLLSQSVSASRKKVYIR